MQRFLKGFKLKFLLMGFSLFVGIHLGWFMVNYMPKVYTLKSQQAETVCFIAKTHDTTDTQQLDYDINKTDGLQDTTEKSSIATDVGKVTNESVPTSPSQPGISRNVTKSLNSSKIEKTPKKAAGASATKPKSKAKPKIDIVNDYYPFVDFELVFPDISPRVERTRNIFMIVLVNSAAKGDVSRKRREAIRQTWANQSSCEQRKALSDKRLKDLAWLLVFVVGKSGRGMNEDELNIAEAKQHNDMLIGNITDNYINNVVKFYMGQIWASRFDIRYTLKTDDDVYVRIPRVLEYLVNAQLPRPFYGGWTYKSHNVSRSLNGKWTVSWKYFSEVAFPKFNSGAFFILSSDLLNRLFNYAHVRKPFHTDDAYVGVAMRDFGVKPTRIPSFHLLHDMNAFAHKATDCKLLSMHGFSHRMNAEAIRFLHGRLELLTCGKKKIKC